MALKYTGGGYGGAVNGVPARDLTDEDIKRLGLDEDALIKGGLYAPVFYSDTRPLSELESSEPKSAKPAYSDKAKRVVRSSKAESED